MLTPAGEAVAGSDLWLSRTRGLGVAIVPRVADGDSRGGARPRTTLNRRGPATGEAAVAGGYNRFSRHGTAG